MDKKKLDISVVNNSYEVLTSGNFITLNDEFKIVIEDLTFIFYFKNDNTKGEGQIVGTVEESKKALSVNLYNFEKKIGGQSTTEPLDIATVNNNKIYLDFNITSVSEKRRQILYTIYTKEN